MELIGFCVPVLMKMLALHSASIVFRVQQPATSLTICGTLAHQWLLKQPHVPSSLSGGRFSASPRVLNHDVLSCAGKQCHVTDGNSFDLLRGSTANMQIPELRTVDLPTPVS